MKKFDLVHATVLIIAILCGYSALQSLLALLNAMFFYPAFMYGRSGAGGAVAQALVGSGVYTVAVVVLVRNSKRITTDLLGDERPEYDAFPENGEAETTEESAPVGADREDLEWRLDRPSLLFALFVGLGLYMLILDIPTLLNEVIAEFRDKVRTGVMDITRPTDKDYLILDLLRIMVAVFLIYAAPTLTNFIEKTISPRLRSGPKTS